MEERPSYAGLTSIADASATLVVVEHTIRAFAKAHKPPVRIVKKPGKRKDGRKAQRAYIPTWFLEELKAQRFPGDGTFLATGVYQTRKPLEDGTPAGLWFSTAKLCQLHTGIAQFSWSRWADSPAAGLSLAVNRGVARHLWLFETGNPREKLFIYQPDADEIVRRATDQKARRIPPGDDGQWLSDTILQRQDGTLWLRDDLFAEQCEVSRPMPGYWRRTAHPALDKSVNKGRLRYLEVPKFTIGRGPTIVIVSSQEDLDSIRCFREQARKSAGGKKSPASWRTEEEIACAEKVVSTFPERLDLNHVLQRFRGDVPGAAHREVTWSRRNQAAATWRYDPVAFKAWRAGRPLSELAKSRPHSRLNKNKILRTIALLRDGLRCGPKESAKLKAAAHRRGLANYLWEAKKALGVKHTYPRIAEPGMWEWPVEARTAYEASNWHAQKRNEPRTSTATALQGTRTRGLGRKVPKRLQWLNWHRDGKSYETIRLDWEASTGEAVTRDQVKAEVRRLNRRLPPSA